MYPQELPSGKWAVIGFETRNVTCPSWPAGKQSGLIDGNEYVEFDPLTLNVATRVATSCPALPCLGRVVPEEESAWFAREGCQHEQVHARTGLAS